MAATQEQLCLECAQAATTQRARLLVLGLWRQRALGQRGLLRLLREDPDQVYAELPRRAAIEATLSRRARVAWAACFARPLAAWLEEGMEALREHHALGARLVCRGDADYPPLLEAANGPAVLALQGALQTLRSPMVAVVGTRQPTRQARELTQRLCLELVGCGLSLCSGGALGIDALAHRAALRVQGRCVVVSATGLDQCYPPANTDIFDEAKVRGALLSQFPLRSNPRGEQFVRRNPTIAGLCTLTVVGQAPLRSGALYTARAALALGRPVMVVATAGFEPQSAGGLLLVRRKEAELLCESSQVFTRMQVPAKRSETSTWTQSKAREGRASSRHSVTTAAVEMSVPESERFPLESEAGEGLATGRRGLAIVRRLQNGSARFDELLEALGEEPALLRTTLLELELEGLVQQHPGEHYSLSVEL